MTKSESAECLKLYTYYRLGHIDMVARSLSALIRAAMTAKSRKALWAQVDTFQVKNHPDFII